MPQTRRIPTPPLARLVRLTSDASQDRFMLAADAKALYDQGWFDRVSIGHSEPTYMMPRTTAELFSDTHPQFPSHILARSFTR